mmetsp:Transcript_22011/g.50217  ORF Transcript_22011/g.50217 Transcript_22011/m.50217 type:complete len:81 (+) Transcript_22011:225-467(+)
MHCCSPAGNESTNYKVAKSAILLQILIGIACIFAAVVSPLLQKQAHCNAATGKGGQRSHSIFGRFEGPSLHVLHPVDGAA